VHILAAHAAKDTFQLLYMHLSGRVRQSTCIDGIRMMRPDVRLLQNDRNSRAVKTAGTLCDTSEEVQCYPLNKSSYKSPRQSRTNGLSMSNHREHGSQAMSR
jgi:hypothetical protein